MASRVAHRTAEHVYREEEIDTVGRPSPSPASVDGHEPSPSERKQDDDRLRDLRENPKARLTLKRNREAQERSGRSSSHDPERFSLRGSRQAGRFGKAGVSFQSSIQTGDLRGDGRLHALSGVVLIDLTEKRLARFSGTLTQRVSFWSWAARSPEQGRARSKSTESDSPPAYGEQAYFGRPSMAASPSSRTSVKHLDETRAPLRTSAA